MMIVIGMVVPDAGLERSLYAGIAEVILAIVVFFASKPKPEVIAANKQKVEELKEECEQLQKELDELMNGKKEVDLDDIPLE